MSELEVFAFAKKMSESVACLRDAGHHVPAVMLTYVGIDQMAWLSISGDKSSGQDFKTWVDTYMLSKNPLPCTSQELWEARNGLLHMGTAESAAHKKQLGIRKILYTFGAAQCTSNSSTDTVFIKAEDLIMGYLTGVLWFMEELHCDAQKLSVALAKLERTLTSRDLTSIQ